jgi:hypothetical protein
MGRSAVAISKIPFFFSYILQGTLETVSWLSGNIQNGLDEKSWFLVISSPFHIFRWHLHHISAFSRHAINSFLPSFPPSWSCLASNYLCVTNICLYLPNYINVTFSCVCSFLCYFFKSTPAQCFIVDTRYKSTILIHMLLFLF